MTKLQFPEIRHQDQRREVETDERCFIIEVSNDMADEDVSIARARVEPGVSTAWHRLKDTAERYLIISGRGLAEVGDLDAVDVGPGDVVLIPADLPQRITNTGDEDLVFYCICSPRFTAASYIDMEKDNGFYSTPED